VQTGGKLGWGDTGLAPFLWAASNSPQQPVLLTKEDTFITDAACQKMKVASEKAAEVVSAVTCSKEEESSQSVLK